MLIIPQAVLQVISLTLNDDFPIDEFVDYTQEIVHGLELHRSKYFS